MDAPESPPSDPVRALVGFTAVLRHAGLAVTTDRVAAFLTAVDTLGPQRQHVYRAGLHTLCADPDDLPRYERAFAEWFDGDLRARRVPNVARPRPRLSTLLAGEASGDSDGRDRGPEVRASASGNEVLRHHDLGELSLTERAHLRALL